MTRTAIQGLVMAGAFVVLLAVVTLMFSDPGRAGARGSLIGAALGLVNLGVGYLFTRRALQRGMKSAMATLAGGFIARLTVVVSLMLVFRRTDSIDPAAFALSFLTFFFVYLGVEIFLVEQSVDRRRRTP